MCRIGIPRRTDLSTWKISCWTCSLVWFLAAVAASANDQVETVAHWDFSALPQAQVQGDVAIVPAGPVAPRYPRFGDRNSALEFKPGGYLRWEDNASPGDRNGPFDFAQGDTLTIEAWVSVQAMSENAYLIGKGRSQNSGPRSINQNWALRLRKQNGMACVNFLFRSQATEDSPGDWHRWTSSTGFGLGPGWHHVAIRYTFGKPESITGIVDGQIVAGKWDMGGATQAPPVVDNDDVWMGSAMDGNPGNSFVGLMDELTVYRGAVSDDELLSHYEYVPREVTQPELPVDAVVMEMFGPHASVGAFPEEFESPALTWKQEALGLTRLPSKYDDWGVRDEWSEPGRGTMLVRAWTSLHLAPGDYQFLIRSRGLSRLFIDGQQIAATPAQRSRTGAHHVVDPLPEVPVAGMRPHYMNDHEQIVEFRSEGGQHVVRFDFNVGGPKFALLVGETCVALARPGEMFQLLSTGSQYPLDDLGWEAFAERQAAIIDDLDRKSRLASASATGEYWQQRHSAARRNNLASEASRQITLDQLLTARLDSFHERLARQGELSAADQVYLSQVQPILEKHCVRCHGDKQQGELSLISRERILQGGESGAAAAVPGHPEQSYLWELVSAPADEYRMPPEGDGLTAAELEIIRTWIEQGVAVAAPVSDPIDVPELVDDATFLRRIYLDTVGVQPTLEEIDQFFSLPAAQRRSQTIDGLLRDPRWADHWVSYWQDALAENPNLLKPTLNNTGPFRYWIYEALADNKPLDQFATELITLRGSSNYGGAAGFGIASQNDAPMAAKAHVLGTAFLGVEMKCARCHDAPYHDWTQQDLFELAAMLERKPVALPESSTVPLAFFEQQARQSLISASLKPGEQIQATWPFPELQSTVDASFLQQPGDTREELALYITSSRRFAEVLANRIWKRLMGSGLVEPVDDWQGHPPSDPELLAYLADTLVLCDYDLKRFCRQIFESQAYQRQASDEPLGVFAAPVRRRMTAEQIVDSALVAAGQKMDTEMLTLDLEGTFTPDTFFNFGRPQRAWEFTTLGNERDRPSLALPRAQAIADVLQAFGWRDSRPEPISQREETPNLVQPGALANGTFGTWLTRLSPDSHLTDLALQDQSVEQFVDRLFWSILTRAPTEEERAIFADSLRAGFDERIVPIAERKPVPARQRYRYVSWSNHLNTEANKIKLEMEQAARRGPEPTPALTDDWRLRAEDAVWALLNNPEMILVP